MHKYVALQVDYVGVGVFEDERTFLHPAHLDAFIGIVICFNHHHACYSCLYGVGCGFNIYFPFVELLSSPQGYCFYAAEPKVLQRHNGGK